MENVIRKFSVQIQLNLLNSIMKIKAIDISLSIFFHACDCCIQNALKKFINAEPALQIRNSFFFKGNIL